MKMYRSVIIGIPAVFIGMLLIGCQPSEEKVSSAPMVQGSVAEPSKPRLAVQEVVEVGGDVPVLSVENPNHDFGEMGPSGSNQCEYKFTNTGQATLKIDRIMSTCGCTVPELKVREYAPGESGVLKVFFRAPSVKGKVHKYLTIVSNDPKNPQFQLGIEATVVVKMSISPEKVKLRFDQDNAGMPDIVVKSLDNKEFAIKSATVANQVMTIPVDPTQRAKEFVLKPVVDLDKLNQHTVGAVQVRVDRPQAGTLAVRYEVLERYMVQRPQIILQNVKPSEVLTKSNFIRSHYGTPVEIESITSRNGYMEIADPKQDGANLLFNVKITTPEKSAKKYLTDELIIHLKDGTSLSVKCSGWFKS